MTSAKRLQCPWFSTFRAAFCHHQLQSFLKSLHGKRSCIYERSCFTNRKISWCTTKADTNVNLINMIEIMAISKKEPLQVLDLRLRSKRVIALFVWKHLKKRSLIQFFLLHLATRRHIGQSLPKTSKLLHEAKFCKILFLFVKQLLSKTNNFWLTPFLRA